jgi:hypothetical protein
MYVCMEVVRIREARRYLCSAIDVVHLEFDIPLTKQAPVLDVHVEPSVQSICVSDRESASVVESKKEANERNARSQQEMFIHNH